MFDNLIHQQFIALIFYLLIFHFPFHVSTISSNNNNNNMTSPIYVHYVRRYHSMDEQFLTSLLERSRTQRDTYDERQKLVSNYKIISKTQCLLQMRGNDGYVDAKHVTNLDDSQETRDGTFIFLPIAVNLFLIQHKQSQRYLCGRNNQLFGLIERNEHQCVFETKRSDVDFGRWDSYRLFYEEYNRGYLSISHMCHTRLRRKYDKDNYLHFLAFVRINTDLSDTQATARRIVNQQRFNRTNGVPPKLINDYRQRFRSTTTPTPTTTTTTTVAPLRRLTRPSPPPLFNSLIVHVQNPTGTNPITSSTTITTRRWRSRRTRRP